MIKHLSADDWGLREGIVGDSMVRARVRSNYKMVVRFKGSLKDKIGVGWEAKRKGKGRKGGRWNCTILFKNLTISYTPSHSAMHSSKFDSRSEATTPSQIRRKKYVRVTPPFHAHNNIVMKSISKPETLPEPIENRLHTCIHASVIRCKSLVNRRMASLRSNAARCSIVPLRPLPPYACPSKGPGPLLRFRLLAQIRRVRPLACPTHLSALAIAPMSRSPPSPPLSVAR